MHTYIESHKLCHLIKQIYIETSLRHVIEFPCSSLLFSRELRSAFQQ